MRQAFHELVIATRGRGLVEITGAVEQWITANHFRDGLLTLHLRQHAFYLCAIHVDFRLDPLQLPEIQIHLRFVEPEPKAVIRNGKLIWIQL